MYRKIMVPVDLARPEQIDRALATAADLATHYATQITYVGVTTSVPSEVAHTPEEFEKKLAAFAREEASKRGLADADSRMEVSHDPPRELARVLLHTARDIGADLIVMASHVPGFTDHIFESNAGAVALHADASVFVVR